MSSSFILFYLVAGAGIAPTARGYEPREILLLHPAAGHYTTGVLLVLVRNIT